MIAVLAFWLAYAPVEVIGTGDCPAPAEVSWRLADMLPTTAGEQQQRAVHHRATLTPSETGVHVELLDGQGQRIAERDLARDGTCADLAAAISVVVAAWEAELDPHVTARVDLPLPRVEATPVMVPDLATRAPPRPSPSFEIGIGLIASLTGGQLAPGARVQGWLAPGGWRVGLGAAVSDTTARSAPVGSLSAAASWTRVAFGTGPEAHFDLRGATVDVHLQALAALLRVDGVGLSTTASDSSTQFGTGGGVHVGWSWGHAVPWVGADVSVWPGHDTLVVGGFPVDGALPQFELQLALGMSLGRFP